LTAAAPVLVVQPSWKLADRMKIQDECIRERRYTIIGRLTSVLFEGQRKMKGFSQARPRWMNAEQSKLKNWPSAESRDAMAPFSKEQLILWSSVTLDWLTNKNAPQIAISNDRQDLLLPFGLTPLPPIPDPRWAPKHAPPPACPNHKNGCADCVAPRIPQRLTGCPVVGDRVRDMLKDRTGKVYGILHPIMQLQLMLGGPQGGFGRISGGVDPATATHLALVIDDSDPEHMRAYFVGGKFQFGG
jgi:hypothetical protein